MIIMMKGALGMMTEEDRLGTGMTAGMIIGIITIEAWGHRQEIIIEAHRRHMAHHHEMTMTADLRGTIMTGT